MRSTLRRDERPAAPPKHGSFITLTDVTLRVGSKLLFEHTSWEIRADQHWAIIGPNGSGKSTLARAIFRQVPLAHGRIFYFFGTNKDQSDGARSYFNRGEIVKISAETHSNLMQQQAGYHQARWQSIEGKDSPTVAELLTGESIERISPYDVSPLKVSRAVYGQRRQRAVDLLGMGSLLGRKVLHLSHGEARKLLIARALMQSPRFLILDDPFVGLDDASRRALHGALTELLHAETPRILLITPRLEEIPPGITHVLQVANSRMVAQDRRDKILPAEAMPEPGRNKNISPLPLPAAVQESGQKYPVLVELKDTSVLYGHTYVLRHINWTMKQGENWAVLGANGAGKTTLLSLILADNPQAYANQITLFGQKRGSGESIWQIKRKIGWVSPELQAYHQKETTCGQVVCSGFFDSVGLYQTCSPQQVSLAVHWLQALGLLPLLNRPLGAVSVGEQRLVFLARALVKNPTLLILDEPCQGLDFNNRTRIIELLDQLCSQMPVNMIYVTHHFDEMPQAITHVLKLAQGRIQTSGERSEEGIKKPGRHYPAFQKGEKESVNLPID
ncbi:MAG: ATP-binding cassette domain-containing protein, partial [Anaerolineae bacterium]|nr:ATP-binding cassette domain-containing protein [Anaerolineae bacterium]